MYKCQECGRKFRTTAAAEKASMDGCPKCGGVDVDLDNDPAPTTQQQSGRTRRINQLLKIVGDNRKSRDAFLGQTCELNGKLATVRETFDRESGKSFALVVADDESGENHQWSWEAVSRIMYGSKEFFA